MQRPSRPDSRRRRPRRRHRGHGRDPPEPRRAGRWPRTSFDQARADGYRAMVFNAVVATNTRAVALWRSLGFQVLATVPEGFHHPVKGYVGLLVMHRRR